MRQRNSNSFSTWLRDNLGILDACAYLLRKYTEVRTSYRMLRKYPALDTDISTQVSENCRFDTYVHAGKNVAIDQSTIGRYTYISDGTTINAADIGSFCSIGPGVSIGLSAHPTKGFVTSHPAFYSLTGQAGIVFADSDYFESNKRVTIGHDVWIGRNVLIKDGLTIGDGAIIGAGAVVVHNIEPYAIVGGVPDKLIRYRFTSEQIDFLLRFKWWNKPESWLREHFRDFANIDDFIRKHGKE